MHPALRLHQLIAEHLAPGLEAQGQLQVSRKYAVTVDNQLGIIAIQ
jgi:hypothetical protein